MPLCEDPGNCSNHDHPRARQEVKSIFEGGSPLLKFTYENWRGVVHEYVIDPESMEHGPYDKNGFNDDREHQWVLHGFVVTRDGDVRPELSSHPGGRRRTFLLTGIEDMEALPRS